MARSRAVTRCIVTLALIATFGGACRRRSPASEQSVWMQRHCVALTPKPGAPGYCQRCSIDDHEFRALVAKQKAGTLPDWYDDLGGPHALMKGVEVCDD